MACIFRAMASNLHAMASKRSATASRQLTRFIKLVNLIFPIEKMQYFLFFLQNTVIIKRYEEKLGDRYV